MLRKDEREEVLVPVRRRADKAKGKPLADTESPPPPHEDARPNEMPRRWRVY